MNWRFFNLASVLFLHPQAELGWHPRILFHYPHVNEFPFLHPALFLHPQAELGGSQKVRRSSSPSPSGRGRGEGALHFASHLPLYLMNSRHHKHLWPLLDLLCLANTQAKNNARIECNDRPSPYPSPGGRGNFRCQPATFCGLIKRSWGWHSRILFHYLHVNEFLFLHPALFLHPQAELGVAPEDIVSLSARQRIPFFAPRVVFAPQAELTGRETVAG